MVAPLLSLLRLVLLSIRDLAPIILVIAFFQVVVLKAPLPDLSSILTGLALVMVGLTLFVQGLELGLFPLGEAMADALARRGSVSILLAFTFALGFGTTAAEPALVAVASEAAEAAAAAGIVGRDEAARADYAFFLRLTVAIAVGLALVIGVVRIVKGWPLPVLIIGGYLIVVAITPFAPDTIVGIAYDAGGVTTSTVTVPLVTALGVGLASAIKGRNPLVDGFGLIAFASLTPMILVMLFGMVWQGLGGT